MLSFTIIVVLCFCCFSYSLIIINPPVLQNKKLNSPIINHEPFPFEFVDGAIIYIEHACSEIPNDINITLYNILLTNENECDDELIALRWQEKTGKAVIIGSAQLIPGNQVYKRPYQTKEKIDIPIVNIGKEDYKDVKNWIETYTSINIRIYSNDENKWETLFHSPYFFLYQFIIISTSIINLIIAIYKLRTFINIQGLKKNYGQSILFLEIVGNIIRIVFCACYAHYFQFSMLFQTLFATLSYPITILSSLIISFLWYEMIYNYMNLSVKTNMFVGKLEKPFYIISIFLIIINLIISIMRAFYLQVNALLSIGITFYAIIMFINLLVFLIVGFKMLKLIKKVSAAKTNDKKNEKVKRITIYIIISGCGMLGFVIAFIIRITPIVSDPWWFYCFMFLSLFSLNLLSFSKIMIAGISKKEENVVSLTVTDDKK